VAPCQVQEEPKKDHITKEDGGGTEHIFVFAVVNHATRTFTMMAAVGGEGAWTGERRRSASGGGGGTPAGEKEEERWRGRRRSIAAGT